MPGSCPWPATGTGRPTTASSRNCSLQTGRSGYGLERQQSGVEFVCRSTRHRPGSAVRNGPPKRALDKEQALPSCQRRLVRSEGHGRRRFVHHITAGTLHLSGNANIDHERSRGGIPSDWLSQVLVRFRSSRIRGALVEDLHGDSVCRCSFGRAASLAPDTPAAGADHALPRWTRLWRQRYDRASAANLGRGGRWT